MLRAILLNLIIVLGLPANFVAAGPLTLRLFGTYDVESREDLRILTILTNSGDEVVSILNDPRNVLSEMPTDTKFVVTSKDTGNNPPFVGVKVKYAFPEMPEGHIDSRMPLEDFDDYTVLEPGQSIEVEHDLSLAYNFGSFGEGLYSVWANNLFYAVDPSSPDGKLLAIRADSASHIMRISTLAALSFNTHLNVTVQSESDLTDIDSLSVQRGPTFRSCSAKQRRLLPTAAAKAQAYVSSGYRYVHSHRSSRDVRYNKWFGRFSPARYATVLDTFQKLNRNSFAAYTYDCTCRNRKLYAYVYTTKFAYVYLCPAFWGARMTGADSMGGILVHEASHFDKNGGTYDYTLGPEKTRAFARSPDRAVHNADAYEMFVENTA